MQSGSKGVIVTGGAAGIGRAIAERFAASGQQVAIWDQAGAAEAAAEIGTAGGKVIGLSVDVSDPDQVKAAFDETLVQFGAVHTLINNAAVHQHDDILDMAVERWDHVMTVNIRGVFLPTQIVARWWVDNGIKGSIVNITSTDSHLHFRRSIHYCASKAAVSSITKSVALALGRHGIRANEIAPGFINAGMAKKFIGGPDAAERLQTLVPLAKAGDPDEVAATALFLSADENSYITGARIVLDGGYTLAGMEFLQDMVRERSAAPSMEG